MQFRSWNHLEKFLLNCMRVLKRAKSNDRAKSNCAVSEPTQWVKSSVLVNKPNGSLRLCLDPRHLNKVILRPHYPFPCIEDCLDASSGVWMIPLVLQVVYIQHTLREMSVFKTAIRYKCGAGNISFRDD